MADAEQTLSTNEVAALMGRSYQTIMTWLRAGLFPGAQQIQETRGLVWRIPASAVINFKQPKRGRRTDPQSARQQRLASPPRRTKQPKTKAAS